MQEYNFSVGGVSLAATVFPSLVYVSVYCMSDRQ
uniref:Uncharacterized protein n=1 Tax=Anguilla anguilla TaxID=7936 RepID=A0A0E9ST83_ANGAN